MKTPAGDLEWLETNHRGSFALGCVDRLLRRKYHALLTVREHAPHGEPWNVLAEVRERVTHDGVVHTLADPLYGAETPGVEMLSFDYAPHPTHRYSFDGVTLERRVRLSPHCDQVELTYRFQGLRAAAELSIEPFVRGRPIHELMVENPVLDGSVSENHGEFLMIPYGNMPAIAWSITGAHATFEAQGRFCTGVHYAWEAARGYPDREDVFCPGTLRATLQNDGELTLLVALHQVRPPEMPLPTARPAGFGPTLARACGQFVVDVQSEHEQRRDVIAGYPWFGCQTRDTLMALPGLHLALADRGVFAFTVLNDLQSGRVAGLIAETDQGTSQPSLEATLLFIRAVQWLSAQEGAAAVEALMPTVAELLEALAEGADPRFRLLAGEGVVHAYDSAHQRMKTDAPGGTVRHGHTVKIDALAYHGLCFASAWAAKHDGPAGRRLAHLLRGFEQDFLTRYWSDTRGHLADSQADGALDTSLRPHQLWATALTCSPLTQAMKASVLKLVREQLWVPAGLRTLSARDAGYEPHYRGNPFERDRAYHHGSVWPGLLGLYADTVLNVHGRAALECELAESFSFFAKHLRDEGCIGQLNEVFDGDAPHAPGGAPAQAWSACELSRVWRLLHAAI
jgi:glycogen debranching enzyme